MKKKALIVNPWITDFKLYDEWMHPTGLYVLISLLEYNGWEIDFVNCLERDFSQKMRRHNTGSFIKTEIHKPEIYNEIPRNYYRFGMKTHMFKEILSSVEKPDIILLGTAMTYWFSGVKDTYTILKKFFPNVPLVVGGISATLMPEIVKRELPNTIVYSSTVNESLKAIPEFKELSFEGWKASFVNGLKFNKSPIHGPVMTSLGCPMRCTYCASVVLQPKFYYRSAQEITDEIRYLYDNFAISNFAFYDDALLVGAKKNFIPLFKEISKLPKDIKFHVPNGLHLGLLTKEILELMHECGFTTLRFGYESGNEKYEKDTSYKSNERELREKVSLIKETGFALKNIGVYIMTGLPDHTVEDILLECDIVSSLDVKVKPVFLSPVPQTPIFEYYKTLVPQIATDYRYHNDIFFVTKVNGWDYTVIDHIKKYTSKLNCKLDLLYLQNKKEMC